MCGVAMDDDELGEEPIAVNKFVDENVGRLVVDDGHRASSNVSIGRRFV